MPPSRRGRAQKAARPNPPRFGNLDELIPEEVQRTCGRDINTHAAHGVERSSAEESAQPLDHPLRALVESRTRQTSRAPLVRRPALPQGEGRLRP